MLKADSNLGKNLRAPSVSYGAINLYMQGVLEEETRGNLSKVILHLDTPTNMRLCIKGPGIVPQRRPTPTV